MTDELTPEERDALKNLPRERMPSAGLEDRVVGAMRQRGLLAKRQPRRVVRITTGRAAGLMAACVALMIGAYSIGLHRGDENDVIRSVAPVRDDAAREIQGVTQSEPAKDNALRLEEPALPATPSAPPESRAQSPAEAKKKNQATEETRQMARSPENTDLRKDEPARTMDEGLSAAGRVEDQASGAALESAARANQAPVPAAQMFARESVAPSTVLQRTFQMGGTTFIVEAPDSVRIVEDAAGRMLLIYTSDGLIRIRLAD